MKAIIHQTVPHFVKGNVIVSGTLLGMRYWPTLPLKGTHVWRQLVGPVERFMAASTPYMPTSFHTKPQLPPVPVISSSRAQPHCSSSSFHEESSPHADSSRVMNEAKAAHTPIVFMAMCCCPASQRSLSRKNVGEKKKKSANTADISCMGFN